MSSWRIRPSSPTVWLGYNINVLIRLMPVVLLIMWYTKTVGPYMSHGPWWDYGVYEATLRGFCRDDPWWKAILYFGFSGKPPGLTCLPAAWFLVVYTQIALVMPLIVYAIWRLPNKCWRLAMVMSVCAISSLFVVARLQRHTTLNTNNMDAYGVLMIELIEKFDSSGLMNSIGRCGCIVIGVYAGYLLGAYEIGAITEWPGWFRSRLTLALVVALNAFVYGLPVVGTAIAGWTGRPTTLAQFVGGVTATSLMWPILNAALIILATTRYKHSTIVRFCGNSFWSSADKLGLGIYLVHMEVLYTILLGDEHGPSFGSIMDIWKLFALGAAISILLAFVIYILFEAPVIAISARYLPKGSKSSARQRRRPESKADAVRSAARFEEGRMEG